MPFDGDIQAPSIRMRATGLLSASGHDYTE
jgi:hypothetical protein